MSCWQKACRTPGTWRPVLAIPARGDPGRHPEEWEKPNILQLGVALCAEHKETFDVAQFVSHPENRARLAAAIEGAGKPAPDFDRTWLTWIQVQ